MIVETIRVSEKARNQLIQLKRRTGIDQWNVLCRWSLMHSLAEESEPPFEEIVTDSSIDIAWKTFVGSLDPAITALIQLRFAAVQEKNSDQSIETFFKLHLHRGISYLTEVQLASIANLFDGGIRT